jgi:type I restriction enzyme S subunit
VVYFAGRIGWRGLKAEEYTQSGAMLLSVHNLNNGPNVDFTDVNFVSTERYEESPEIKVRVNDVLLTKDGAGIGKTGFVATLPAEATVNSSLLLLRSLGALQPRLLFYSLIGPRMQSLVKERITGSTTPHLFQKDIKHFELLIPPSAEQQRIVAKIKALLARVNAARQRLAKVPAILKRFRQSVLAAACSGRLTAEWRERQGELDPDPAELPGTWKERALSELCKAFEYGSSKKSEKCGKVPVLRMGNIQEGEIDWTELVYSNDDEEITKYSLTPNTVLFNRTNSPELVGKTGIYRGGRSAIFAGYLIRIRTGSELDPVFLNLCLNAPAFKEYCLEVRTDGVSQSNINARKLAEYSINWCPLPEQNEIVRRVEALFRLADAIEKRVAAATARAGKLTQSILAKAFRGELVPTEAELARREGRDYEPASVLLEQIRAEKEKSKTAPRARVRRTRV